MDLDEETKKIIKRTKRIEIDDEDLGNHDLVLSAFPEHLQVIESGTFISPNSSKSAKKPSKSLVTLYSEVTHNNSGDSLICGLVNGEIRVIIPSQLSSSVSDSSTIRKHTGLSCIRCSKAGPNNFFSSSDIDGDIFQWDIRESPLKAAQKFCLSEDFVLRSGGESSDGNATKPILNFDVSCNDQIICGGTELKGEDSYLLFWDIRSTKLLGAYWESHSDDITAVKFHPDQTHSLASGSTDGLLNVFNLLETEEDDALLYSFNTESSVDCIHWCHDQSLPSSPGKVLGLTHTNDIHLWNAESGDQVAVFPRNKIAESMMRSNPEAVHVNGCYQTGQGSTSLLACSLSGDCARLLDLSETGLLPKSVFLDQLAVIQTAQFLRNYNRWITSDEDGCIKLWSPSPKPLHCADDKQITKGNVKNKKRFQPYGREKSQKNK